MSYPLKVTGEILLSSKIKGSPDSINIYPSIKLEEGADISYMGANLGDENSIREFSGDFRYVKDNFIIKNLDYSKYIYSQNNKLYPLPLVNLKAEMKFIKDKIFINNMDVKTFNPINANIFNTIFKKSIIKSGKMTCDINIKGYADKPKILGQMNIKNVQAPSVETSVEEINAYFNPKNINIITKANYLGSDINILAKIKNNNFDIIHFDNLEIHSSKLNLDRLLHSLNEISYSRPIQILGEISSNEPLTFKPETLLIDNGKWIIDNIIYKTIPLNNFSGKLSLKNSRLKLDEVLLNIAGGNLKGNFNYDFKKATIYAKTKVEQVDANEMANTFFDIKNQIFGKLDGDVEVTTTGANDEEQKQNLNGVLSFSINQGKMPKLGSLEYLLRAGNLLKSGISGLTINNIKSILIPVQSGEFDTIQGNLNIVDGLAKNIKIYSKGQNLSILIFGDYNIPTSVADIYVLGKLSKNIDSILGPIGNASLNSFFNLIPGIHLDEAKDTDLIKQINSIPELGLPTNKFRIFRVKIGGDLNSEEFVNTFEWLDK